MWSPVVNHTGEVIQVKNIFAVIFQPDQFADLTGGPVRKEQLLISVVKGQQQANGCRHSWHLFLDYPRDGAVIMFYIFALLLEYLLPLILKAIGHSVLSHSLIPKSMFTLHFSTSHDDTG